MGEKEVISFEKYKDKSKSPPVSLQEQSYPVCTDVSPAFILCFQTNGCCETDWESRPTSAYSEVAIRYTENGCGKSSLFREQFVKLTMAIKFARKAWWAQHQTSNLPSVGRCGQIAPRRITQELYWICLGGKKNQQSAASNCWFFSVSSCTHTFTISLWPGKWSSTTSRSSLRFYLYLSFCCLVWNMWVLFWMEMYFNGCLATGHLMKSDLVQLILCKIPYTSAI